MALIIKAVIPTEQLGALWYLGGPVTVTVNRDTVTVTFLKIYQIKSTP